MLAQTSKQKKIMNIIEKLSPEKLDKVIDFTEFLKEKREPQQKAKRQQIGISSIENTLTANLIDTNILNSYQFFGLKLVK